MAPAGRIHPPPYISQAREVQLNVRKKRRSLAHTALLLIFLLAVPFFRLSGQEQPTPDALRKQADTLLKQRHYPAAISAYQKLIEVTDQRTNLSNTKKKAQQNEIRYQISQAYFQDRNYQQAIAETDKVTGSYAKSALYIKGYSYQSLGQYPQAIASFEKLAAGFPRSSLLNLARFQIARTLYFQGKKLQALLAFSRLPKEPQDYPDNPETARKVAENIKFIAEQLRVKR
jgi:tetratricopeptide (TPR) repeat protein